MHIYVNNTFALHVLKSVLAAFTAPNLPKIPTGIKDPAAVVYGDEAGIHVAYIYEVEDARAGEVMKALVDRATFMGARIEGYTSKVVGGRPLMEAVGSAQKLLP
ncbi:MAG: hypothetical protein OEW39_12970 [Deltaproteobacteria bacterium]|nr:hypothetical protein [Deltaproteobacteria bacterium]